MPDITNMLTATTQTFVNSYQTLAQKAVKIDGSQTGAVAALERFFYKLDFLLTYGYLPSKEDTDGSRLSPEIQELKAFLEMEKSSGESYVLYRNNTERYRFVWLDNEQLAVNLEKLNFSLTANRFGYVENTWRLDAQTNIQARLIQSAFFSTALVKQAFPKETKFSANLKLISKNNLSIVRSFSNVTECEHLDTDNKISTQDMIEKFYNVMGKVKNKPLDYIVFDGYVEDPKSKTSWFNSCVADLYRCEVAFNGVKLDRKLTNKIINVIAPNSKSETSRNISSVNVQPLNETQVTSILADSNYDETERNKIRSVLLSPQFCLAFLAVTSQSLLSATKNIVFERALGIANLSLSVENYCDLLPELPELPEENKEDKEEIIRNKKSELARTAILTIQGMAQNSCFHDIKTDECGNLFCSKLMYLPYFDKDNNIISATKQQASFVVPEEFAKDCNAQMDIKTTLETKLRDLLPLMQLGLAVL